MDWNITCDDLSAPFEPTAEDFEEGDTLFDFEAEEEEADDLSDLLGSFDTSFLGLVDTLNGYRV